MRGFNRMIISKSLAQYQKRIKGILCKSILLSSLFCIVFSAKSTYAIPWKGLGFGAIVTPPVTFMGYVGVYMMDNYYNNRANPEFEIDVTDEAESIQFFYTFLTGDVGIDKMKAVHEFPINEHKVLTKYERYNDWDPGAIFFEWCHVVKNFFNGQNDKYMYSSDYALTPSIVDNNYRSYAELYLKMLHSVLKLNNGNKIFTSSLYSEYKTVPNIVPNESEDYLKLLTSNEKLEPNQQKVYAFLEDIYENLSFHAVFHNNAKMDPLGHSVFSRKDYCLNSFKTIHEREVTLTKDRLKTFLRCKLYTVDKPLVFSEFVKALKGEPVKLKDEL